MTSPVRSSGVQRPPPPATRLLNTPRMSRQNSSAGELASAKSEGDLRGQSMSDAEHMHALQQTVSNCESVTGEKLAALTSPCYFHRRFGDTVDISKVLSEIASDESMSHSRLVQTATGIREVSKQLQRRPIKRASRTVLIVTKARDNNLVLLTRELAEWLMRTPRYGAPQGVTVYVDDKLQRSKRFDAPGLVARNTKFEKLLKFWTPDICWSMPEQFDLVITLGGDGTVLYTSWLFQRVVPPVLSFSLGSLGFLTPFGFSDFREHLDHVMGGRNGNSTPARAGSPSLRALSPVVSADLVQDAGMQVNFRMRFTCTVFRSPRGPNGRILNVPAVEHSQFEVLNELVIDRGPSPYVSNLELFGDDNLLTVIQADGVIFSTPTGSTAYSLSAGGSLVHPDIPAILLTPICPHTLSFRPMLLNDTVALRVAVPRSSRATAYCSFDGKSRIELRQGDYVNIMASKYPFPTVVGGKMEWIDSVSRTLRWNTRQAQQKGWGGKGGGDFVLGPAARSLRNSGSVLDRFADMMKHDPAGLSIEEGEDNGEGEDFDIDIDDEDEAIDSRDSGYDGDVGSNASGIDNSAAPLPAAVARNPVRQQTL